MMGLSFLYEYTAREVLIQSGKPLETLMFLAAGPGISGKGTLPLHFGAPSFSLLDGLAFFGQIALSLILRCSQPQSIILLQRPESRSSL
jgi:hypothetical protein